MLKRNKMEEKKKRKKKGRENQRDKITEGTKFRRDFFRRDKNNQRRKIIAHQHKVNEGEEKKVI